MMLFEPSDALTRTAEARLAVTPPHLQPMWLPVVANDCALAIVNQREGAFTVPTTRPAILLVGDDDAAALGPAAFHRPSLAAYLRRCRSFAIVAGAPDVAVYTWIGLQVAAQRHDCALIETRPEFEDEWRALIVEVMPDGCGIVISSPTRRETVH